MRWGGIAPVPRELFEVELAAALTGGPLRADVELDPQTRTALSRVEAAPAEQRWAAAERAREVFEKANAGTDFGAVPEWIAARCCDVATTLATGAISWCSAQLRRTGADVYGRYRAQCVAELAMLNPRQFDLIPAWITDFGAQWARWRAEADGGQDEPEAHRPPSYRATTPETEILSIVLGQLAASDAPAAVVVSGSPCSGVAATVRWHAAAMPGAAIVEAGVFAGFHPHGAEVGLGDAGVSADVGDWLLQAVRHVVHARANVVISVADMAGLTGQCARILEPAGYRVRCVETTIPEPLRRLSELVCAQTVAGQWVAVSAVAGGAW